MPYQSVLTGNNLPATKQAQYQSVLSGFVPGQYAKVNAQIAAKAPSNFTDVPSLNKALHAGQINQRQWMTQFKTIQAKQPGMKPVGGYNLADALGNAVHQGARVSNDVSGGTVNQFARAVAATPLAIGREIKNKPITDIQQKAFGTTNPTAIAKKIIGSTAGTASMFLGGGQVKGTTEGALAGAKVFARQAAKNAAIVGGGNVASTLTNNPNATAKQLIKSGVAGAGMGVGLTAGGSLLGAAVNKAQRVIHGPNGDVAVRPSALDNQPLPSPSKPPAETTAPVTAENKPIATQQGSGGAKSEQTVSNPQSGIKPSSLDAPSKQLTPESVGLTAPQTSRSKTGMNEAGSVNPGAVVKDTQAMLQKHAQVTKATGNIAEDYAKTAGRTTDIKLDTATVLKNRAALSTADKQTLQDYRDAKAAGLSPEPLPVHLQQADKNITALNAAAQKADAEKARLTGDEAKAQKIEARNPETYTHRIAQGKGSNLELTVRGDRQNPLSIGSLSKTTAGSKKQTFFNATDEAGNRRTVAVKAENGTPKVTALSNGGKTAEKLGSLNQKTNIERMQTELRPTQNKIDSLEREQKILSSTKNRSNAASQRLSNIKAQLQDAYRQHAAITNKYDMNDLENKTFVGADGKKYTLGQATTSEITKNTGQKYYIDPELTSHLNYADSRVALENTRFVEGTKQILEDKGIAYKQGETAPKNYQTTQNPYFAGYKLQPKVAEVLDDIAGGKKTVTGKALAATSRVLRNTIVFLPIKHDFNEGAGYIIDRGLTSWLNPVAYGRMGKALYVATKEVGSQGPLYRQMLREGTSLMTADDKQLGKVVQKQVKDMMGNKDRVVQFGKAFGMSPQRAYSALQKVSVWDVQDILNVARVHERMQGTMFSGKMSFEDALKATEKTNFQYKVPSRVMGSRAASEILAGNTPLTYFGKYTYDKFRIAKNILKGAADIRNPKAAFHAADQLAATVAIASVLWPMVDKGVQKLTGDKNAHITAPGVASIPEVAQQVIQGKKSITGAAGSQVSVAQPITLGAQLLGNKDSFTGKNIHDPNSSVVQKSEDTAKWLLSQLSPAQKVTTGQKNTTGNKTLGTALSLLGVSVPKNSPEYNKLSSLKNDTLPDVQAQAKSAAAKGNTQKAIGIIAQYDQRVLAQAQAAAKAEGKAMPTTGQLKKAGYYYDPTNATIQSWTQTKASTSGLANILNQTVAPKKGEAGYYQYEAQKRLKAQQTKTYNRFHPDATKPIL